MDTAAIKSDVTHDFRVQTSLKKTEPVNIFTVTSSFSEEKGLNSFNSNQVVSVCVCFRGALFYINNIINY